MKELKIKGRPPHIQNKQEGGYGTLKRRDYLQPHQPTRGDYADVQVVYETELSTCTYLAMPTKSDARKAARTTYKRKPTQAELPNGYTLDSRMSGKRAKVYVHKQNPDVIIAHRGTQGVADK
jgi:hypothetical protein